MDLSTTCHVFPPVRQSALGLHLATLSMVILEWSSHACTYIQTAQSTLCVRTHTYTMSLMLLQVLTHPLYSNLHCSINRSMYVCTVIACLNVCAHLHNSWEVMHLRPHAVAPGHLVGYPIYSQYGHHRLYQGCQVVRGPQSSDDTIISHTYLQASADCTLSWYLTLDL